MVTSRAHEILFSRLFSPLEARLESLWFLTFRNRGKKLETHIFFSAPAEMWTLVEPKWNLINCYFSISNNKKPYHFGLWQGERRKRMRDGVCGVVRWSAQVSWKRRYLHYIWDKRAQFLTQFIVFHESLRRSHAVVYFRFFLFSVFSHHATSERQRPLKVFLLIKYTREFYILVFGWKTSTILSFIAFFALLCFIHTILSQHCRHRRLLCFLDSVRWNWNCFALAGFSQALA